MQWPLSYLGLLSLLWANIDYQQHQGKQNTQESKHGTLKTIYKSHCLNQYSYMLINIYFIGRTLYFLQYLDTFMIKWQK